MELKTREDIARFIESDEWMMDILRTASELNLPDWWIAAGFPRNLIWDEILGYEERTPLDDIDVVYYDPSNLSEDSEKEFDKKLNAKKPEIKWSTKNQARMHVIHNVEQYKSSEDAISKYVETPTCIGASLNQDGRVIITGSDEVIDDVINLIVRKNPETKYIPRETYVRRVKSKGWKEKWPNLEIIWD